MPDTQGKPVGYKSPPVHSRFRKGGPQPKRKRTAAEGIDAQGFFSKPVMVSDGETTKKIHPFELSLRQLVKAAIKGDMRKARLVLEEFRVLGFLQTTLLRVGGPRAFTCP